MSDTKRTPRSLQGLRDHPDVADVSDERGSGDGVFVYLRPGLQCVRTATRMIHEDTVSEVLAAFRGRICCPVEDAQSHA
jgi:hypothetical protein